MSAPSEHTVEIDRRYHRDRLMDIIGHPPGWLLQSGTGLIAFITALLICLAWFIRYPDIIEAPVVITSDHPPVEVYTNHAGIIDSIFVRDGEQVIADQILMYLQNTASLPDVLQWKIWLASVFKLYTPEEILSAPPEDLVLGELHSDYTIISQQYKDWYRLLNDKSVPEKIKANRAEILTTRKLMASLHQQISIYDQELGYQQRALDRDGSLYKDKVISTSDHEKSATAYLAASRQRESMATGILTHQMRIDQLESETVDMRITYENQLQAMFSDLFTQCREALASIEKWKEEYIVKAQIPGWVSMPGQLMSHAYISTGEPLMAILPHNSVTNTYARASVASSGLGRIEPGDKVIIRLDAWPYKQYGSLRSEVQRISPLPLPGEKENKTFELKMSLAEPIVTTTGTSLILKPQESGVARIITRDRRILERLFDQLLQLTNINP